MAFIGRGRQYTRLHELWEKGQSKLFTGGWPAGIAYSLGLQNSIQVKKYEITLEQFPKNVPALHLAFATDFHAGPVTHPQFLKKSVKMLEQLHPDVILFGGDFVSFDAHYIDYIAEDLSRLSPRFGKFAVLGNHDLWTDDQYLSNKLAKAGIKLLINKHVALSYPYQEISVCGLDDWCTGHPDADKALNSSSGIKIVLMHTPSSLLNIQDKEYDIALCGHTHGGQIALPGLGPVIAGSGPLCRKYNYGRFALGSRNEKILIVSRGIGYGTLPFRFIAWPEIVLCRIHGEAGM